ncbi:Glutathione transferase omega-1 [Toxocara canis]|uniref:Glutathione-dependent dehydroascorbate reductase n=1 Tax=Toxocara canis TaxID=6265 RepID=A0A0B2USH4_TOXCA|nr:Glutathione transferase omega-1 [Toxocara canis]
MGLSGVRIGYFSRSWRLQLYFFTANFSLRPSTMVSASSLIGVDSRSLKKGDPAPDDLRPGQFRIYSMRFCPFAERALIYLAKKGIKAEVVNINLSEKPDWYFKKHPEGKVPALEYNGNIVVESAIIPQYLDDLLPETSVLPKDPYERAKQRILLEQLSSFIGAVYGVFRATPEDRQAKEERLHTELAKAESLLEKEYFGGDHAGFADYMIYPFYERLALFAGQSGDHAGFADYMIYPFYERLALFAGQSGAQSLHKEDFPGRQQYHRLTKWFRNMQSLPEITAAQQPPEMLTQYLHGYIKGIADYDLGL